MNKNSHLSSLLTNDCPHTMKGEGGRGFYEIMSKKAQKCLTPSCLLAEFRHLVKYLKLTCNKHLILHYDGTSIARWHIDATF